MPSITIYLYVPVLSTARVNVSFTIPLNQGISTDISSNPEPVNTNPVFVISFAPSILNSFVLFESSSFALFPTLNKSPTAKSWVLCVHLKFGSLVTSPVVPSPNATSFAHITGNTSPNLS